MKTQTKQPTTHTAGPWKPEPHCGNAASAVYIQQPDEASNGSWVVATCWGPEREANARLIASAPDLLSALQDAVSTLERLDKHYNPNSAAMHVYRAAISRATT